MSLLTLQSVSTHYGPIQALKNISFGIREGEITVLVGSNGAGKTTLLKTICGMIAPSSGTIHFDGCDRTASAAHTMVSLGMNHVPEGRGVFPKLTVQENLSLGCYFSSDKKKNEQHTAEALELFPRLGERLKQYAGTLSGGEQQMLAMARALIQGGKLLLLDEPSMGLAPKLVDFVFETIIRINKLGKTILLVEQNAHMALSIGHSGFVLQCGEIVLSGDCSELAANDEIKKAYLGLS